MEEEKTNHHATQSNSVETTPQATQTWGESNNITIFIKFKTVFLLTLINDKKKQIWGHHLKNNSNHFRQI